MPVLCNGCGFFSRGHAPAVWPPLVTDERPVRWHQGSDDPAHAQPLAHPPVSPTLGTASALHAPEYGRKSARTSAGFPALAIVPYRPVSLEHHRLGTSCHTRGRRGACLPSLAVGLGSPLQVDACASRIRPLLHTCVAVWPGRGHCRRTAAGRMGLGTSRFRLASDDRLGGVDPSVGSLYGFFEDSLPDSLLRNNSI